jgi:hypothetical protein
MGSPMVGDRTSRRMAAGETRLSTGRAMPSWVSMNQLGQPSNQPTWVSENRRLSLGR